MSDNKEPKDTPKQLPVYGPKPQIVPWEEKPEEEDLKKKRRVIDELVGDVELPWVNPPRESDRGQA